MFPTACNNEQKVKINANPQTLSGKPANLDGGLQIEKISGDGTFATIPGEPNSVYVISGDAVGKSVYRIFADVDLGAGQTLLEDTVELEVSGAQAASFGLTAGSPEPK